MHAARLILAAALLAFPALPQDDLLTRVTVNQVRVDVNVTDSKGNSVPNLTADDFQVFQDGKQQSPIHVQYVPAPTLADPSPRPHELTRNQVQQSTLIILDDAGMPFDSYVQSRSAVLRYITNILKPGNIASVVPSSGSASAVSQFTSDPLKLQLTVERMRYHRLSERPSPFPLINTIRTCLGAMGKMPGRKSLIIFTTHLPNDLVLLDTYRHLADSGLRASTRIYGVDARGLYASFTSVPPNAQVIAMSANHPLPTAARIMLTPSDPGQQKPALDDGTGLFFLASETGGLMFDNSNDLGAQLGKALADQNAYYLVAWNPGDKAFLPGRNSFNDYHNVKIKVTRPGYFVRTFQGFYGFPTNFGQLPGQSPKAAMQEALLAPFQTSNFNIRLTPDFVLENAAPYLRSFVYVDGKDINFVPYPDGGRKDCYAVNLEFLTLPQPVDRFIETFAESQLVSLEFCGKSREAISRAGLAITMRHPIKKPGAYDMRLAVRNVPGSIQQAAPSLRTPATKLLIREDAPRVGSAHHLVIVPDWQKDPAIFGFAVHSDKQAKSVDQPRTAAEAQTAMTLAYREAQDGDSAIRLFHPGETLHYSVQLANIQDANTTLRITPSALLLENARTTGDIHLPATMHPGTYLLQLTTKGIAPDGKPFTGQQELEIEIAHEFGDHHTNK